MAVIEPLTDDEVARVVGAVKGLAPEAVAIALLFAFRHPQHEQRLAGALRGALPDLPIATSHEVLPVFREFERASTTTVEAYLRPSVSAYLVRLERDMRDRGVGTVRVMTSSGGTLSPPAAAARSASLALSGPAGGGVGARSLRTAGGRRRRHGARAQARERGPGTRSPSHGAAAVRRRRPAVRVSARRCPGDGQSRHSPAPRNALRDGARVGGGARRSDRLVSSPARRPGGRGRGRRIRAAPRRRGARVGRWRLAPLRGLPLCRSGL